MPSKKSQSRPTLRLIRGGLHREVQLGGIRIVAGPKHRQPFPIDAVVSEEDTYLVLSEDPGLAPRVDHPLRAMTDAFDAKPKTPGTVILRDEVPLKLLAIVHDLNEEPTWREEWVERALDGVFHMAKRLDLQSIGLPFLGTQHGRMGDECFLRLLRRALERTDPDPLERLWLVMPERADPDLLALLEPN